MNSLPAKTQSTLLYLVKDNQILLAMKKRGFGVGRWNGVGGKLDAGETPEQAITREAEEEIGVVPTRLEKVAVLDFSFPDVPAEKKWDQVCTVYLCSEWQGNPQETEEMAPKWFARDELPYELMWSSDPVWLPAVLSGGLVKASFVFDSQQHMVEHKVTRVSNFN